MACGCKKPACKTCEQCTSCQCICNGPKRKRGRPPKSATRRISPRKTLQDSPSQPTSPANHAATPIKQLYSTTLSGPSHLLWLLNLPSTLAKHLPSKAALRSKTWDDFTRQEKNYICRFLTNVTRGIADFIAPHCADELLDESFVRDASITEAVVDGLRSAGPGSI